MRSEFRFNRIITFGTFDVLHIGHLRILERAAILGREVFVGISTDDLNLWKKGRRPIFPEEERKTLIAALRCVTETFYEESFDLKENYIRTYRADALVMGSDWQGKFDYLEQMCRIIYLPRTPSVSTTAIVERIRR